MSSLKQQGVGAFIWELLGRLAKHGTGFIVTIFLARLLEPSDFGLIAMIMVVISVSSVFTDMGLGGALIQRRRLHQIHYASVFYFNLFVALILSVIVFFSAENISAFYNNDKLELITQVMAWLFLNNALSNVQATKLRKELNYALITKASVASGVLSGTVGVVLAFNGAGVWSLVTQSFLSGIVYNIILWTMVSWRPSLAFSFKALQQLWGYGFRMFMANILDSIFNRLDYLIIGKLFAAETLGFFQRAKALNMMVVQYSSGSLMSVMFPILSKLQHDLERFRGIVLKTYKLINFVVFLMLGVLYLISEELIVLLFTEKWLPSVQYFEILVFSGFAYPVSAVLVNILTGRGNSKAFLRLEIYKKIIFSLNLIIGFYWGLNGYLYGLVLASSVAVYLNIIYATKEINVSQMVFIKPLLTQMSLSILSVVGVLNLNLYLEIQLNEFSTLVLESSEFIVMYLLLNKVFLTQSYNEFMRQIQPIKEKIRQKIKVSYAK